MNRTRVSGFTLIELMVTVVIISILAAIAYPSYMKWTTRSRRTDGESALTQLAAQEEKYFTMCNVYTINLVSSSASQACPTSPGVGDALAFPTTSPDGYYNLSVKLTTTQGITTYTLYAAPILNKQNDPECQTLMLDSTGKKGSSTNNTDCWQN